MLWGISNHQERFSWVYSVLKLPKLNAYSTSFHCIWRLSKTMIPLQVQLWLHLFVCVYIIADFCLAWLCFTFLFNSRGRQKGILLFPSIRLFVYFCIFGLLFLILLHCSQRNMRNYILVTFSCYILLLSLVCDQFL